MGDGNAAIGAGGVTLADASVAVAAAESVVLSGAGSYSDLKTFSVVRAGGG